jgi:hypothetical protein
MGQSGDRRMAEPEITLFGSMVTAADPINARRSQWRTGVVCTCHRYGPDA